VARAPPAAFPGLAELGRFGGVGGAATTGAGGAGGNGGSGSSTTGNGGAGNANSSINSGAAAAAPGGAGGSQSQTNTAANAINTGNANGSSTANSGNQATGITQSGQCADAGINIGGQNLGVANVGNGNKSVLNNGNVLGVLIQNLGSKAGAAKDGVEGRGYGKVTSPRPSTPRATLAMPTVRRRWAQERRRRRRTRTRPRRSSRNSYGDALAVSVKALTARVIPSDIVHRTPVRIRL